MPENPQFEIARPFWAGPGVVIICVLMNLAIRAAAVAILKPPPLFAPLQPEPPIRDTILAVGCAAFIFRGKVEYGFDRVGDFRALAWKVLLISFIPDLVVAMQRKFAFWPEAAALMLMHVASWAICVTLLPRCLEPLADTWKDGILQP
jgi:hypothetical protein